MGFLTYVAEPIIGKKTCARVLAEASGKRRNQVGLGEEKKKKKDREEQLSRNGTIERAGVRGE